MAQQRPAVFNCGEEAGVAVGMIAGVEGIGGAVLVDIAGPAADHAVIEVTSQEGDLPRETFRQADVVGIHPRNERRAGFLDQLVEAGDEAAVLAHDGADTRIAAGIIGNDLRAGIA